MSGKSSARGCGQITTGKLILCQIRTMCDIVSHNEPERNSRT